MITYADIERVEQDQNEKAEAHSDGEHHLEDYGVDPAVREASTRIHTLLSAMGINIDPNDAWCSGLIVGLQLGREQRTADPENLKSEDEFLASLPEHYGGSSAD